MYDRCSLRRGKEDRLLVMLLPFDFFDFLERPPGIAEEPTDSMARLEKEFFDFLERPPGIADEPTDSMVTSSQTCVPPGFGATM